MIAFVGSRSVELDMLLDNSQKHTILIYFYFEP